MCVGAIGTLAVIRWRLLYNTPYPTGLDGGNWLAFGHAIFGEQIRSSSLMYPPVVPLAAVACERVLGSYVGIQALAFLAAAAPPLGLYTVLYCWGLQWRAAVLAGLLASSAGTGEAMLWGGYPQLIGLGILPLFILALDRFLTSTKLWRALPAALLLAAALATSDLIGPLTALVGGLYLSGRYVFLQTRRRGNSIRNVLLGIVLSVVLALPLMPTYAGLIAGVAGNERLRLVAGAALTAAVQAFNGVTVDLPSFWLLSLIVALTAPLVLVLGGQGKLTLLSSSVLLPILILLVAANENRLAYLVPLGIVIGLAAWWEATKRLPTWSQRSIDAALVASLVFGIVMGTQAFALQRNYYTVLNPGVVRGLAQLDALSGPHELLAVSPAPKDWELGWWVEGVARRPSIYAGNPIWLNYADEKARNSLANRIFASAGGFEGSRLAARKAGAAYLFVDKEWRGYTSWVGSGAQADPSAVVYENESVLIVTTVG
jgi:hypothetical protein